MLRIGLKPGLRDGKWACLRPICGHDEVSIDNVVDGVELIDRLLVPVSGTTVGPGRAAELAVCDCDRLCAAIYAREYGEWIESTLPCRTCGLDFEATFSLRELAASLEPPDAAGIAGPDADGFFTLSEGRRFRLPTGDDQRMVAGRGTDEAIGLLVNRCIANGSSLGDTESLETAMSVVGPTLDVDFEVSCPHCSSPRTMRFDIQAHILRVLSAERRFLFREIHKVAQTYQWSLPQILDLTREDRRTFVRMINAERAVGERVRT
jgi:hypothetical protein